MAEHGQRFLAARLAEGQPAPEIVDRGGCRRSKRRKIERGASDLAEPEIAGGFELEKLHVLFDEIDEGQEQIAVAAVLVKVARMAVRGYDDDCARLEQRGEQPGSGSSRPRCR